MVAGEMDMENKTCTVTRLGLTPNSEPAREDRTFPSTGTLNSPLSWNACTKYGITLERKVS